MKSFLPILALVGLVSCPTKPDPVPSPTPTPKPAAGPLIAQTDGTWRRDGRAWQMHMVTVCCKGYPDADPRDLAKHNNWPLTSIEFIDWISFHKQNATHIRTLMNPIDENGALFSSYEVLPDRRVNLDGWNTQFFVYLGNLIAYAELKDVIVEVDLWDVWRVEHRQSPLCRDYNVNGVNECGMESLRGQPSGRALAFVRKIVEETGRHANVIYQTGNESFKGMSYEWEIGIRDEVRRTEGAKGYVRHPIGTQNNEDAIRAQMDYVTFEQQVAPNLWCNEDGCKPTHVNETSPLTTTQVVRQAYRAAEKGTAFGFWQGEQSDAERGETLIALQGLVEGAPNPFPTPASCPFLACFKLKIHNILDPTFHQIPEPAEGGYVVVDNTPQWGKCGDARACNDEHDNCGGRKCEAPDGYAWRIVSGPQVPVKVQNVAGCETECPAVPCRADHGYQVRLGPLVPGSYVVESFTDGSVDCDGNRVNQASGRVQFEVR